MYLKRLLALLCSLALVFCLLPSTAFAEGGNGNIDGGGGSMGQGTSSNFWNPGNDGVRITVVDADSGNAISSPIDFTNRSQNNVVHFGKVNKLQYLAGTALTPQSGAGYGKEIDRCATEGGMFQAIKYCNPKYTASLNKVLDALEQMELADHAAEDDGNETEHFEEETADE